MTSLSGTGALIRLFLRLDRVRLPVWALVLGIVPVGTASAERIPQDPGGSRTGHRSRAPSGPDPPRQPAPTRVVDSGTFRFSPLADAGKPAHLTYHHQPGHVQRILRKPCNPLRRYSFI